MRPTVPTRQVFLWGGQKRFTEGRRVADRGQCYSNCLSGLTHANWVWLRRCAQGFFFIQPRSGIVDGAVYGMQGQGISIVVLDARMMFDGEVVFLQEQGEAGVLSGKSLQAHELQYKLAVLDEAKGHAANQVLPEHLGGPYCS